MQEMPKTGMFKFARLSDIPESYHHMKQSLSQIPQVPKYIPTNNSIKIKSSSTSNSNIKSKHQSATEITLKEYKREFAHRHGSRQRPRLPSKFTSKPSLKDPNTTICSSISMLDLR